ncbi:19790_t:CDS:2, partial [Racocetra persica]
KRQPWVLSAISCAFTKISMDIWNTIPDNTNAGESAHANINRDGQNLSLLAAIYNASAFDQRQWSSVNIHELYNVPSSSKNKSQLQRTKEATRRIQKRKEKSTQHKEPTEPKKRKRTITSKENNNSQQNSDFVIPDDEEQTRWLNWEQKKLEILERTVALKERLIELNQQEKEHLN